MDALQKFPLNTLKGRDCPGANKKLSLRHVQNSLRGGKSLGVKIKRISQMVMASRPLERSRWISRDRLGLHMYRWEVLLKAMKTLRKAEFSEV